MPNQHVELKPFRLWHLAPVFNLIERGVAAGHFTSLYSTPPYMAGLARQLFSLLIHRLKLPDNIVYRARALVLSVDGQFAGFIILRYAGSETEIYMCSVLEEYRHQGLGSWMVATAIEQRSQGTRVRADCLPASSSMKALLRNLGFQKDTSHPHATSAERYYKARVTIAGHSTSAAD